MYKFYVILIALSLISVAKLPTLSTATTNLDGFNTNHLYNASQMENVVHTLGRSAMENHGSNPIKTIVIDPGHGGRDSGGLGSNTMEKDIVLSIGLILEKLLKTYFPEINVILTRDEDVFIPLHKRAEIANKNDADLFISIHCNVAPGRSEVQGSETFVLGLHRAKDNLEVAKRENAVIKLEEDYEAHYDGYDPNSPEGHIILSAYQNAYLGHSIRFASLVEQEFQNTAKRKSRGVKQAGFLVLRQTTMPSVLVEAGFLSNREEEKYLATLKGQQEISLSILRSIQQYLKEWGYEATVKSPTKAVEEPTENSIVAKTDHPIEAGVNNQNTQPKVSEPEVSRINAYFSIQLATTSQQPELEKLPLIEDQEYFILNEGGNYRILSGKFTNYESAANQREKLKQEGFKDAFVIGVENEVRIPVSELLHQD